MILLFFTNSYPYGTGETFIENEIKYLSARFSKIYIFPLQKEGKARPLPEDVLVVNLDASQYLSSMRSFCLFLSDFFKIILYLSRLYLLRAISYPDFRKLFAEYRRLHNLSILLNNWLEKNKSDDYVFYSYWFIDWATVLATLKGNGIVRSFHARAHGYDIYNERHANNFIPFRNHQLLQVTTVSTASKAGFEYLTRLYSPFTYKFKWYRLGVEDNGVNVLNTSHVFTIASCSNVIDIKRVNLIVEILSYIKWPTKWVHFGDGPLLNEVRKQAKRLPSNISYEFKGRVPNKSVLDFYLKQPVDLFITTTETEGGCPVSIQEAISFGIPVIGTRVGGVPEVVTSETGWLIDGSFEPKDVAALIATNIEKFSSPSFRANVRSYWEREFCAKINFNKYIDEVLLH